MEINSSSFSIYRELVDVTYPVELIANRRVSENMRICSLPRTQSLFRLFKIEQ